MTSLAEERREQKRWRARQRVRTPVFELLLENEFLPQERQAARLAGALSWMLRFAAAQVPYYGDRFAACGIDPGIDEPWQALAGLPVLGKLDVQDNAEKLLARRRPNGETRTWPTRSSGTTGRPTVIQHTLASIRNFTLLKQREYRWFRWHPAGVIASIRLPTQLSPKPDGMHLANDEVMRLNGWPYLRGVFATGRQAALSATNPIDKQIAFLRGIRPDYLLTYSETLEHLTFAAEDARPVDSLSGVIAISEQLTGGMRRRIENSFGVAIQQNYGLNEIGLVASRCEAGRYHVHGEHCLVETLDEAGQPVSPGETGRLVITTLVNTAMPLLRYDSGDLAVAVAGPCPCGRTLPSFGRVIGRYSRIAYLPEGTLPAVGMLRETVETLPAGHVAGLRQFQIHQHRDNAFTLRAAVRQPLPGAFAEAVQARWQADEAAQGWPLSIVEVDEIPRGPGGKFQVFTSDFMPELGDNT